MELFLLCPHSMAQPYSAYRFEDQADAVAVQA